MKYNEQYILDEVSEFIGSTYTGHYVSGTPEARDASESVQVNDLIMSLGHGEGAFISNAIKYLARYGTNKNGRNIKDLHKAIHNIVLLVNLNHIQTDDQFDDLEEEFDTEDLLTGYADLGWDRNINDHDQPQQLPPRPVGERGEPSRFAETRSSCDQDKSW